MARLSQPAQEAGSPHHTKPHHTMEIPHHITLWIHHTTPWRHHTMDTAHHTMDTPHHGYTTPWMHHTTLRIHHTTPRRHHTTPHHGETTPYDIITYPQLCSALTVLLNIIKYHNIIKRETYLVRNLKSRDTSVYLLVSCLRCASFLNGIIHLFHTCVN